MPSAPPEYDMPVQQEPEEPDETPVHYGPPPPRPPATEPAPPAPEPSEPAPEPEIPKTAHLPEDFDPIRERGPAGSYTRTKHSMRFDRLTDPQEPRNQRRPEPTVFRGGFAQPAPSLRERIRSSTKLEMIAGWIVLGLIVVFGGYFMLGISQSQERLDARLTGRQDKLDGRQAKLEGEHKKVVARQSTIEGKVQELESGVTRRAGYLDRRLELLQTDLRRSSSAIRDLNSRLARDEQQMRTPTTITGTLNPNRQSNINQNPPIANLPMQKPAGSNTEDTHRYEEFVDLVPGPKAELNIATDGKKDYLVPFASDGGTEKIEVRPYGSSTAGTFVHAVEGSKNGRVRPGQHWVISPSGGWMGPVAQ